MGELQQRTQPPKCSANPQRGSTETGKPTGPLLSKGGKSDQTQKLAQLCFLPSPQLQCPQSTLSLLNNTNSPSQRHPKSFQHPLQHRVWTTPPISHLGCQFRTPISRPTLISGPASLCDLQVLRQEFLLLPPSLWLLLWAFSWTIHPFVLR